MNLYNWIPSVIYSTIILGGFVAVTIILFMHSNPADYRDIALILLGNLSGMALTVIGKWLSTISTPEVKDEVK